MQFVLPVLENNVRQRHTTTLHIMLAFLLFGIGITCEALYWFTATSPKFGKLGAYQPFLYFGIACIAGSAAILLLNFFQKSWLRKEQNNLLFRIIELGLLGISSVLFFLNGWKMPAALFGIMTLVVIFAIVREKNAAKTGKIIIDESGILLQLSARSKIIGWKEIDAVLLRFGILTIEYADNHLFQQHIGKPAPDTAVLEQYCTEKIEAHKLARVANDW